eukprot:COSAG02_NODE_39447_length_417_cov_0.654088_3_plen_34_part_01
MQIDFTYVINLNTQDTELSNRLKRSNFPTTIPFY